MQSTFFKTMIWVFLVIVTSANCCFAAASANELAAAEKKLLGKHLFSLQWISWEQFGTAIVKKKDGELTIKGKQELKGDYVLLEGTVKIVNEKHFVVTGKVTTKVHHINGGQPCSREGDFDFLVTGQRKYWRMQQMQNTCDSVTDYVDVFFK